MTDPRLDFLDRLEAATRDRMRRVDALGDTVRGLTGEATSPDRLVRVRVSASGALVDLELDDEALELDARDLAASIVATARAAAEQAARSVGAAVEPLQEPLEVAGQAGATVDQPSALERALARAEQAADRVQSRVRSQES